MYKLRMLAIGWSVALLAAGTTWAQDEETFPSGPDYGDAFELPDVSGEFNPMTISTQDVAYGGSGSVDIPFTINQRGTVWVVIYRKNSGESGERGPAGAWLRFEAQDLYIATTPGQVFESGSNSVTWDGNDWEGNAAGAGAYEFDVVAVNNVDKPVLAGPGAGPTSFTFPNIDTSQDPPEIWVQEFERANADRGHTAGDMIRGTLGTDYLANPNAWERWRFDYGFEGARTFGGMRIDDQDPEIFWASHRREENGGLYKIRINRAANGWDRVSEFGNNGQSVNANGDRIVEFQPYGEFVYNALQGRQEVFFCAVEVRDKTTGEITQAHEVTDFYLTPYVDDDGNEGVWSNGPGQLTVTDEGIWTSAWGHENILRLDHDGNVVWANRNGDLCGDRISNEAAAAIGALGGSSINNLGVTADRSSNLVLINAGSRAASISALGRDGSCAFEIEFPSSWGLMRPGGTRYNWLQEDGAYDGLYSRNAMRLETFSYGYGDDETNIPYGPGTLLYTPMALSSGKLGSNATAVLEVAGETPDAYSLGNASPNPFNPNTVIEFTVPDGQTHVKLQVYNATGQLVATLADKTLQAGTYQADWDARDLNGQQVASGVYYYRMEAGQFVETRSMTFLK